MSPARPMGGARSMIVARTRRELEDARSRLAGRGTLALVPTMGYLHEGHLSLVDAASSRADVVAASVFVNPLQFGPSEDLEDYPRDEERDLALLRDRGVELVFLPTVEEMYPEREPLVTVDPGPMADVLCGRHRPGHFRGVLTVVAKLFGLVRPDVAVFGRKDYQQGVLIRRMATDLDMGVEIVLSPVVREEDGLALSSRNAYLSSAERGHAVGLSRALGRAREGFRAGERSAAALLELMEEELAGRDALDPQYVEVVHPATLQPLERVEEGSVAAMAVFCGDTRLIDNVELR